MKLLLAVLNINIFAGSLWAHADNTPNLCTDDIPNLTKIKPSDTADHTIPDITVGAATYNGDADHFVVRPPLVGKGKRKYKRVLVYIPGTTDRPELSSCLIKSAAETLDFPILALSYQYLSSGDSFRNAKCALLTPALQITCLEEQHKDAIEGGTFGASFTKDGKAFWGEVLPENSLKSRLGDLLAHLHAEFPTEGWDKFFNAEDNRPVWDNIIVSGHSQGAGHVAYLAKTETLCGAVMISGPQDQCTGCSDGAKFWIDEGPYASKESSYTALGHSQEPLFSVMADNWGRMKAADMSINWKSVEPANVDFAIDTDVVDALRSPLRTDVQYAATSTCGGKEHCSTAIDDSVPFIETYTAKKLYLYEAAVWPSLLKAAGTKGKSGKTSKASKKSTGM
uniref:1-alkyl-2-acetylglycerophosphocholine esterase n=1 Tax=Odontella aurita TaxID=265563 RepID=A0A7S4JPJ3_9STRA|mmetsp:Transcript_50963/g.153221  ORF Transcript_50963/g.153221 Transcript_50963/m.153221 type:complete len:395 (+) Transcript_50963:198-1382(+)|eukprot:CAMPEP_0113548130 /NCGR_PEP_ID=MMETSP0015_2-20120614/12728_1 /TAXON_ID=2838 /ORGANISM="Odontella" /LENGTH=394 /DNA_ID=CAMNT_0000448737 /DNA_START=174 /DNA_END=1358 /DNA_ORIENTATION=+ /assembly_acc=CAM_ASM_000160